MSEYIPWSDDLSVGLQEIDEQHKILIGLINSLYSESILKKADQSTVDSIINELKQYTIIHFSVEESLFRLFDYPYTEAHQKQHDSLKEELAKVHRKFKDGEPVNIELMSFLRRWIKNHILMEDKKYAPFFLEKGLKGSWSKQQSWIGKVWNSIYLK
ncbi:MAG: bacteriohemerythrin [Candidatus Contendobacter sp.]|nr:bacteriohemerythrin [Candidatus Contendobacter sp.]